MIIILHIERCLNMVSSLLFSSLFYIHTYYTHYTHYTHYTGRNWYEVIRQLDALLLSTFHRVVVPSNWGQGQDVMLHPTASAEEASLYRFVEAKPWFRIASCPEQTVGAPPDA
jgi:hypothetical protein